MRLLSDGWYEADEGNYFVLTEKGKQEWASFRHKKVGEPIDSDPYDQKRATRWMVEGGAVEEVADPDWVVMPAYKVVYYHKGHELNVLNGSTVIIDKEIAERIKNNYPKKHPWFEHELHVVNGTYKGKRPKPCREHNEKRVFNWDYWHYDAAEIGDLVEEKIVWDGINAVPPACMDSDCMQIGEVADFIDGKNVYETFSRVTDDIFEYKGLCWRGENVARNKEKEAV